MVAATAGVGEKRKGKEKESVLHTTPEERRIKKRVGEKKKKERVKPITSTTAVLACV